MKTEEKEVKVYEKNIGGAFVPFVTVCFRCL